MRIDLDIVRHADDNTPFTCSSNLIKLLSKRKIEVYRMYQWFQNNYFKLNVTY